MRKILHIVFIIILFCLYTCTHKKYTNTLLYYNDLSVTIYDSNGNPIGNIINDVANDKFVLLQLYSIYGDKAYITARYAFNDTFNISGYISKNNLGIRTINSDTIFLYETPDIKATKVDTIVNADWTNIYRVLEVKHQWLYIEGFDDNDIIKGWISPQDQCSDPITVSC